MHLFKAVLLGSLGLACVAFVSCSGGKKVEEKIIRPVRYEQVAVHGGELTRTFSGVSRAGVEVKMSFKVAGTVRTLNVKVGDKVAKGKLIAALDKADLQLMYEQAKVAQGNAKVQMQAAKSAFDRTAALYENRSVSLQDYEVQASRAFSSPAGSFATQASWHPCPAWWQRWMSRRTRTSRPERWSWR
ncbi:MAG: efflux RND transporter periplasmic adaptor subunit [Planctomycetota bacterium]|jgi:multidrug efflux pump subunit AcrA (membrane-fusion protein)